MSNQLPLIPRIIFTQAEPLSLLGGFLAPIISPSYFISSQLPSSVLSAPAQTVLSNIVAHDKTATLLAWQLGNAYLLLGFLGVFILNSTTELRVVRAYLLALWLGDIGHVGFTLWAMGYKGTLDVGSWNAVVWGNIGATVFLFVMRTLYFLGAFGQDLTVAEVKAKKSGDKKKTRKE